MIIQHNITAMNSHRQLSGNNSMLGKNLEKLSSGFRINRAGDDAAGLSISEKMRAQIKGLETATKNAKDGISLIQTAEGALTEVHSMIDRMATLATQSANGTYNADQRSYMQDELNKLLEDIDRISEGTNFNGTKLLDGTLGGGAGKSGVPQLEAGKTAEGVTSTVFTAATFGKSEGTTAVASQASGTNKLTISYTVEDNDGTITQRKMEVEVSASLDANGAVAALNQDENFSKLFVADKTADSKIIYRSKEAGKNAAYVTKVDESNTSHNLATTTGAAGVNAKTEINGGEMKALGDTITIDGTTYQMIADGGAADSGNIGVIATKGNTTFDGATAAMNFKALLKERGIEFTGADMSNSHKSESYKYAAGKSGSGLSLQVGDTYEDANKIAVNIKSMSAAGLGIKGLDISSQASAGAAIDKISKAKEGVSAARSAMGALQNRLEHVINNLGVATENMAESESRIRDVDMAHEMMAFTKNNILTQAAQSMLAQANQLPQGVLQLLR